MTGKMVEHEGWPERAAGLAVLGALLAVAIERIAGDRPNWEEEVWRSSAAAFLAVSGLAFGFTLERLRPLWSLAFALVAGTTVGLIVLWNDSPSGWSAGTEWRMVAAGLVIAIAAPLFQAARDAGRLDLSPTPIQSHAWTNVILWAAAWAFTGLSFLLAHLLAELFLLIGIDLLRDALRKDWFAAAILGAALGGAIGLLRNRDAILGQLQRVVVTILSVLAPVLAAGLVLFVAALPFTGLGPLWETTRATTPILLLVIGGAFILANAVLGNAPEEEARAGVLRWSALALAIVMAPLAIVAAVSTWLRIDQYGFSPDRLWALVFVGIVLAISLTYLWTALRPAFAARIRPANVRLALALCGVGLLLATPLIDFGALSTRDQLARLQSGRVPADQFDWAALRFDFGPAGRRAIAELQRLGSPDQRRYAAEAARTTERYRLAQAVTERRRDAELERAIRVLPAPAPIPADLRRALAADLGCRAEGCVLHWQPGSDQAVAIGFTSPKSPAHVALYRRQGGQWRLFQAAVVDGGGERNDDPRLIEAQQRAVAQGRVDVRTVPRRQVFIDGRPVGGAFP